MNKLDRVFDLTTIFKDTFKNVESEQPSVDNFLMSRRDLDISNLLTDRNLAIFDNAYMPKKDKSHEV